MSAESYTLRSPVFPDGIEINEDFCEACVGQGKLLEPIRGLGLEEIDPCPRCGGSGEDPFNNGEEEE